MFQVLMWKGLRRGVNEKSKPWLVVGVVLGAVKVLRFLNSRDASDKVVYSEKLRPGESLVVSNKRPVS